MQHESREHRQALNRVGIWDFKLEDPCDSDSGKTEDTMETCFSTTLLVICCMLVGSELSCEPTQFLGPDGTCVACPACGPGEQLSEDCGFGDGGAGVCVPCDPGTFSRDTGVAPCVRCTQCGLLNRQERTACSPTGDARCGRCLLGYYELRGLTGEVEPSCLPCSSHHTACQECLGLSPRGSKIVTEEPALVVLTVSSAILSALLLWAFLLAARRLSQRLGVLDHDLVQDMSLLLGPATSQDVLRRMGQSLGVLTQVAAHLRGFQDLFQYLHTSTCILLPQLGSGPAPKLLPGYTELFWTT